MSLNLKDTCLNKICSTIKTTILSDLKDCESIVKYISQLPKEILLELEQLFFEKHYEGNNSIVEMQYATWYKVFLEKPCSRFWLNKQFRYDNKTCEPLVHAIDCDHHAVVKVLLDTLEEDHNFVDVKVLSGGVINFLKKISNIFLKIY